MSTRILIARALDSVLESYHGIFIASFNVDDGTILRPANSYISAKIVDNVSKYYVSPMLCPYDYCLPHPSNLKLSNPNSQCQFQQRYASYPKSKQFCESVWSHYSIILTPCKHTSALLLLYACMLEHHYYAKNITSFECWFTSRNQSVSAISGSWNCW